MRRVCHPQAPIRPHEIHKRKSIRTTEFPDERAPPGGGSAEEDRSGYGASRGFRGRGRSGERDRRIGQAELVHGKVAMSAERMQCDWMRIVERVEVVEYSTVKMVEVAVATGLSVEKSRGYQSVGKRLHLTDYSHHRIE